MIFTSRAGAPASAGARRLLLVALLGLLPGCGGDSGGTPVTPQPTTGTASVEVSAPSSVLRVGQTMQLAAAAKDASGAPLSGRTFSWASTSEAVATVGAGGLVTSVAPGTVTIRATADGKSGEVTLSVSPRPVGAVVVTPAAISITVGGSQQLAAAVSDTAGGPLTDRAVSWSSSDPSIVSVSPSGVVSAAGVGGPVTITASAEGKSGAATVTVTPVPVATVALEPGSASLRVGASTRFRVVARDGAGNVLAGRAATLVTSNAAVATVDASGLLTAVGVGTATLTATVEGKTAVAEITVVPVPVASLAIEPATASIQVGATLQLRVVARDAAGNVLTGRAVSLTSSNPAIVAVDASRATGVAEGTARVTATSEGQSAVAEITVSPVPVASLAIEPATASVAVGATLQLRVVARDAAGNVLTGRPVTLTSQNGGVATVDAASRVTGVAEGTTRITATSEGKTASAEITVTPAPVASLTISPASFSIAIGGTQTLTITARDAAGNLLPGRPVTLSTSNVAVAGVNPNGLVSGNSAGTATITATSGEATATAQVTVSSVDLSAPTLHAFSASPTSVDVSGGSATVSVTMGVRDFGSGARLVQVRMFSPSGKQITDIAYAPASGTRNDGTFVVKLVIPQNFDAGTFSIASVELGDEYTNGRSYSESQLQAAGYSTKIQVTASGADVTPPSLESFAATPAAVDVSNGSATVSVAMALRDVGSGVRLVQVRMFSPSGKQITDVAYEPASGTRNDGTFVVKLPIPQNFDAGTFSITSVEVSDALGNGRSYTESQLQAAGYSTKIQVTASGADVSPPSLHGFTVSPTSVDVSGGSATVSVAMALRDVGSGVRLVQVRMFSPSGKQITDVAYEPASGTRNDGTFVVKLVIPQNFDTGTFAITSVEIGDALGNGRSYSESDLQAAGYATRVQVTP